jgi:hypothetical protein
MKPRKRFGQHFLASAWADKVVAAISPAPGDVFLEIGPGPGSLTLPLAATGAPVVAVEIDRDLAYITLKKSRHGMTLLEICEYCIDRIFLCFCCLEWKTLYKFIYSIFFYINNKSWIFFIFFSSDLLF